MGREPSCNGPTTVNASNGGNNNLLLQQQVTTPYCNIISGYHTYAIIKNKLQWI